jgi:ABC-type uncharacterized transport system auxiliary subunit
MIGNYRHGQMKNIRIFGVASTTRLRRISSHIGAGFMLIAFVAGCGKSRPIKYYDLTVPGGLAPTTQQALPINIIVALPAAPDLYRDNRLVYSINDQQLGKYESERWAAPPPELIRDVFLRSLRASGRYAGVYAAQSTIKGDYSLRTRLYDFKEQDTGNGLVGRVSMDLELRSLKSGEIVWQHYYTHDEPIAAKTVPDVAAALNRNVQMAANEINSGIEQYFAAHPPK